MWDKRPKPFLRAMAMVMAVIFGATDSLYAASLGPSGAEAVQAAEKTPLLPGPDFSVPEDLGKVVSRSFVSRDKPTVIILQDAHAVADAQLRIRDLAAYLGEQFGFESILMEGTEGDLDPVLLRAFPQRKRLEQVMNEYLQRGEITGIQLAALFQHPRPRISGLENWGLYRRNYDAYLNATSREAEIRNSLDQKRQGLDLRRSKILTEKAENYFIARQSYREHTGLWELLSFYRGQAAPKHHDFKLLTALSKALPEAEDDSLKRDVDRLAREINEFLDSKTEFNQEQAAWGERFQAYRTGRIEPGELLVWIRDFSKRHGDNFPLTKKMQREAAWFEELERIDAGELSEEIDAWMDAMDADLFRGEAASLMQTYDALSLLDKLASLRLSRSEWGHLADGRAAVFRRAEVNESDFEDAAGFYETAIERDSTFLRAVHRQIQRGGDRILVVAGGFHAEGLREALKEQQFNVLELQPKMQSAAGGQNYASLMRGQFSYKEYLKDTYYDAFMRHVTSALIKDIPLDEMPGTLKQWRDNVIRSLGAQSRTGDAWRYLSYIDLLLNVYRERLGLDAVLRSEAEARRIIEAEIKNFGNQVQSRHLSVLGISPRQHLMTLVANNLTPGVEAFDLAASGSRRTQSGSVSVIEEDMGPPQDEVVFDVAHANRLETRNVTRRVFNAVMAEAAAFLKFSLGGAAELARRSASGSWAAGDIIFAGGYGTRSSVLGSMTKSWYLASARDFGRPLFHWRNGRRLPGTPADANLERALRRYQLIAGLYGLEWDEIRDALITGFMENQKGVWAAPFMASAEAVVHESQFRKSEARFDGWKYIGGTVALDREDYIKILSLGSGREVVLQVHARGKAIEMAEKPRRDVQKKNSWGRTLSRKQGQAILVEGGLRVKVLRVDTAGQRVRLLVEEFPFPDSAAGQTPGQRLETRLEEIDLYPQLEAVFRLINAEVLVTPDESAAMRREIEELMKHQSPYTLRNSSQVINLLRLFDPDLDGRITQHIFNHEGIYAHVQSNFSTADFYNEDNLFELFVMGQLAAEEGRIGKKLYEVQSAGTKIMVEGVGGAVPDSLILDNELGIPMIGEFKLSHSEHMSNVFPNLRDQKLNQIKSYIKALLLSRRVQLPQHVLGGTPEGLLLVLGVPDPDDNAAINDIKGKVRNWISGERKFPNLGRLNVTQQAIKELKEKGIDVAPADFEIMFEFYKRPVLYRRSRQDAVHANAHALTRESWDRLAPVLNRLMQDRRFAVSGPYFSDIYGYFLKQKGRAWTDAESEEYLYYQYLGLAPTLQERLRILRSQAKSLPESDEGISGLDGDKDGTGRRREARKVTAVVVRSKDDWKAVFVPWLKQSLEAASTAAQEETIPPVEFKTEILGQDRGSKKLLDEIARMVRESENPDRVIDAVRRVLARYFKDHLPLRFEYHGPPSPEIRIERETAGETRRFPDTGAFDTRAQDPRSSARRAYFLPAVVIAFAAVMAYLTHVIGNLDLSTTARWWLQLSTTLAGGLPIGMVSAYYGLRRDPDNNATWWGALRIAVFVVPFSVIWFALKPALRSELDPYGPYMMMAVDTSLSTFLNNIYLYLVHLGRGFGYQESLQKLKETYWAHHGLTAVVYGYINRLIYAVPESMTMLTPILTSLVGFVVGIFLIDYFFRRDRTSSVVHQWKIVGYFTPFIALSIAASYYFADPAYYPVMNTVMDAGILGAAGTALVRRRMRNGKRPEGRISKVALDDLFGQMNAAQDRFIGGAPKIKLGFVFRDRNTVRSEIDAESDGSNFMKAARFLYYLKRGFMRGPSLNGEQSEILYYIYPENENFSYEKLAAHVASEINQRWFAGEQTDLTSSVWVRQWLKGGDADVLRVQDMPSWQDVMRRARELNHSWEDEAGRKLEAFERVVRNNRAKDGGSGQPIYLGHLAGRMEIDLNVPDQERRVFDILTSYGYTRGPYTAEHGGPVYHFEVAPKPRDENRIALKPELGNAENQVRQFMIDVAGEAALAASAYNETLVLQTDADGNILEFLDSQVLPQMLVDLVSDKDADGNAVRINAAAARSFVDGFDGKSLAIRFVDDGNQGFPVRVENPGSGDPVLIMDINILRALKFTYDRDAGQSLETPLLSELLFVLAFRHEVIAKLTRHYDPDSRTPIQEDLHTRRRRLNELTEQMLGRFDTRSEYYGRNLPYHERGPKSATIAFLTRLWEENQEEQNFLHELYDHLRTDRSVEQAGFEPSMIRRGDPLARSIVDMLIKGQVRSGQVFGNERYEIVSPRDERGMAVPLGSGATAETYLAFDRHLRQKVAVKVLKLDRRSDGVERLIKEWETMRIAPVEHAPIVYDYGIRRSENPADPIYMYIIMTYMEGTTLHHLLSMKHIGMSARLKAQIIHGIAQALEAMSRKGLLHRDLKPENTMVTIEVTERGEQLRSLNLLDFGIAKSVRDILRERQPAPFQDPRAEVMTDSHASLDIAQILSGHEPVSEFNQIKGTPLYISGEQTPLHDRILEDTLSPASDLFALGVILYQLLTGNRFPGSPNPDSGPRRTLYDVLKANATGDFIDPQWLLSGQRTEDTIPHSLNYLTMMLLSPTFEGMSGQRLKSLVEKPGEVWFWRWDHDRQEPVRFLSRDLRDLEGEPLHGRHWRVYGEFLREITDRQRKNKGKYPDLFVDEILMLRPNEPWRVVLYMEKLFPGLLDGHGEHHIPFGKADLDFPMTSRTTTLRGDLSLEELRNQPAESRSAYVDLMELLASIGWSDEVGERSAIEAWDRKLYKRKLKITSHTILGHVMAGHLANVALEDQAKLFAGMNMLGIKVSGLLRFKMAREGRPTDRLIEIMQAVENLSAQDYSTAVLVPGGSASADGSNDSLAKKAGSFAAGFAADAGYPQERSSRIFVLAHEWALNQLLYAQGGVLALKKEVIAADGTLRLRMVARDAGKGIPDPNAQVMESLFRSLTDPFHIERNGGKFFRGVLDLPGEVQIDSFGRKWRRGQDGWYKRVERTQSSVERGAQFSISMPYVWEPDRVPTRPALQSKDAHGKRLTPQPLRQEVRPVTANGLIAAVDRSAPMAASVMRGEARPLTSQDVMQAVAASPDHPDPKEKFYLRIIPRKEARTETRGINIFQIPIWFNTADEAAIDRILEKRSPTLQNPEQDILFRALHSSALSAKLRSEIYETLVRKTVPLAKNIVRKLNQRRLIRDGVVLKQDDLEFAISAGLKLLPRAVQVHHPDKGEFPAFLTAIFRSRIPDDRTLHDIVSRQNRIRNSRAALRDAKRFLRQDLQREPTAQDIADYLGWTVSEVMQKSTRDAPVLSLSDEETQQLHAAGTAKRKKVKYDPTMHMAAEELRDYFANFMPQLSPREQLVLKLLGGFDTAVAEGYSRQEAARMTGMTVSHIGDVMRSVRRKQEEPHARMSRDTFFSEDGTDVLLAERGIRFKDDPRFMELVKLGRPELERQFAAGLIPTTAEMAERARKEKESSSGTESAGEPGRDEIRSLPEPTFGLANEWDIRKEGTLSMESAKAAMVHLLKQPQFVEAVLVYIFPQQDNHLESLQDVRVNWLQEGHAVYGEGIFRVTFTLNDETKGYAVLVVPKSEAHHPEIEAIFDNLVELHDLDPEYVPRPYAFGQGRYTVGNEAKKLNMFAVEYLEDYQEINPQGKDGLAINNFPAGGIGIAKVDAGRLKAEMVRILTRYYELLGGRAIGYSEPRDSGTFAVGARLHAGDFVKQRETYALKLITARRIEPLSIAAFIDGLLNDSEGVEESVPGSRFDEESVQKGVEQALMELYGEEDGRARAGDWIRQYEEAYQVRMPSSRPPSESRLQDEGRLTEHLTAQGGTLETRPLSESPYVKQISSPEHGYKLDHAESRSENKSPAPEIARTILQAIETANTEPIAIGNRPKAIAVFNELQRRELDKEIREVAVHPVNDEGLVFHPLKRGNNGWHPREEYEADMKDLVIQIGGIGALMEEHADTDQDDVPQPHVRFQPDGSALEFGIPQRTENIIRWLDEPVTKFTAEFQKLDLRYEAVWQPETGELLLYKHPQFNAQGIALRRPEIRQNPSEDNVGFSFEWTSPEKGLESVKYVLQREHPDIMEAYGRLGELSGSEKEALRNKIYGITRGHFSVWKLSGAFNPNAFSNFNGSYIRALQKVFDKLDLDPLGFQLDWTSPEKGLESVKYVLQRERPDIMEAYGRLGELIDSEKEALRNKIYGITKGYFSVWGLNVLLNRRQYFNGSHIRALQKVFDKLDLDPLGFQLDWTSPEKGLESVKYVLQRERPDIMEAYGRLGELSGSEKEALRNKIYGITKGHFSVWGLNAVFNQKRNPYFGGSHIQALLQVFDDPALEITKAGFRSYRKKHFKIRYRWSEGLSTGITSVTDGLYRNEPQLMEQYGRIDQLSHLERQALRDEIYGITAGHFRIWGLSGAMSQDVAPYFDGSHIRALQAVFDKLDLNPLGYQLDWASREKGIESVTYVLKRERPDIMEAYGRLGELSDSEKETLRNKVYGITWGHFSVWGLRMIEEKNAIPYFDGSHIRALQAVFDKLDLNSLGFQLDWTSPEKGLESVKYVLKRERPDIMEAYGGLDELIDSEKEALRNKIYGITKGHFNIWGLASAMLQKSAPYFNGSHIQALKQVFKELDLKRELFMVPGETREETDQGVALRRPEIRTIVIEDLTNGRPDLVRTAPISAASFYQTVSNSLKDDHVGSGHQEIRVEPFLNGSGNDTRFVGSIDLSGLDHPPAALDNLWIGRVYNAVREAVDNGLESHGIHSDKRVQVRVHGELSSSFLNLVIEDDGPGIDSDVIYRKLNDWSPAGENKLLTTKSRLDPRFQYPVTHGRGIGIIYDDTRSVGGAVQIETRKVNTANKRNVIISEIALEPGARIKSRTRQYTSEERAAKAAGTTVTLSIPIKSEMRIQQRPDVLIADRVRRLQASLESQVRVKPLDDVTETLENELAEWQESGLVYPIEADALAARILFALTAPENALQAMQNLEEIYPSGYSDAQRALRGQHIARDQKALDEAIAALAAAHPELKFTLMTHEPANDPQTAAIAAKVFRKLPLERLVLLHQNGRVDPAWKALSARFSPVKYREEVNQAIAGVLESGIDDTIVSFWPGHYGVQGQDLGIFSLIAEIAKVDPELGELALTAVAYAFLKFVTLDKKTQQEIAQEPALIRKYLNTLEMPIFIQAAGSNSIIDLTQLVNYYAVASSA